MSIELRESPPEQMMVYQSGISRLLSGNLSPDQEADLAIIVINDMQSRIDAIVACAEREISSIQACRKWLINCFTPQVTAHAVESIPKKKDGSFARKYYRTMAGGSVFFVATGNKFQLIDEVEYKAYLNSLSVQKLRELGGEFSIPYVKRQEALKLGISIPGHEYVPKDEFGRIRFGTDKPWSPKKLLETLKVALEGSGEAGVETIENP